MLFPKYVLEDLSVGSGSIIGKGMEHFPRRKKKLFFDSILRANYKLDASSFDIT
jgi:hypothetical protein